MIVVVCSVVVERNGKYLFVCEKKQEAKGKYGLPGGQLEHAETLLECARRELQEETGYDAEHLSLVSITHKPFTHKHNSVVRFVYRASGPVQTNKSTELQTTWLTEAEAAELNQAGRIRGEDVLDTLGANNRDLTVRTY
jgi:ADP-ribose pyrophosphatase YjhB (NUDIX family)